MKSTESGVKQNPKRRLVVVFIFLVVVSVGVTWFLQGEKPSVDTTTGTAPAKSAQINITANGFEPNYLEVAPGTIVTWVNQDSQNHQVAADPYPINNSFNLGTGSLLTKSATQEFLFSEAGSFTYHDELNPTNINGKVVVK